MEIETADENDSSKATPFTWLCVGQRVDLSKHCYEVEWRRNISSNSTRPLPSENKVTARSWEVFGGKHKIKSFIAKRMISAGTYWLKQENYKTAIGHPE